VNLIVLRWGNGYADVAISRDKENTEMTVATDPTDSSTGTTKDAPDSLIPLDVLLRQRLPGAFSDNDVVEIARLAYEELELRVGTRLSESLTDVQLAEFEALIDSEDHEGAQHFLDTQVPGYKDVVRQECDKVVDEVVARILKG
jgi:hypothetical protein